MISARKWLKLSVGIETLGCALIGSGIVYEVACQEPIGYLVITVGSFIFALGGAFLVKTRKLWKSLKKGEVND